MHLKQPGFTFSACWLFTKSKIRIQKFKETGDANHIYKNELDKAQFQHDTTYEDFKDLARRTASDRILKGKAFNIAINPKYDGYQRGLASPYSKSIFKFFLIKSLLAVVLICMQIIKLSKINNCLRNYTKQLFKNLRK